MITVDLSSYHFKQHVASDVPIHGQFVHTQDLKTQSYIDTLDRWSDSLIMKLNQIKTKYMIINYTNKYKFSTRLALKNRNIEQVHQAKVLGKILNDELTWGQNCRAIVKKVQYDTTTGKFYPNL